jgi:hypothetical protein
LQKLTGQARKRWETDQVRARYDPTLVINDLTSFGAWIVKNFGEYNANDKRWDEYERITQGRQAVQAYASTLGDAATRIDPPVAEASLIRKFITRSRPELRKRWGDDRDRPATFQGVVERFAQYEISSAAAKRLGGDPYTPGYQDDNRGDPMDLSAIAASPDRPKKNSPAWKAWCRQHKACFDCGDTTHLRPCPKSEKSGQGRKNKGKENDR